MAAPVLVSQTIAKVFLEFDITKIPRAVRPDVGERDWGNGPEGVAATNGGTE